MNRPGDALAARALLQGANALVVEADAITAFEIEQLLLDLGAGAVRIAGDAAGAIGGSTSAGCDLAIVDVGAGVDAARLALLADLRARGAPHVALTSCAPGDPPLAALADAPIVFKPFTLFDLTTGIEAAARRAAPGQAIPAPTD